MDHGQLLRDPVGLAQAFDVRDVSSEGSAMGILDTLSNLLLDLIEKFLTIANKFNLGKTDNDKFKLRTCARSSSPHRSTFPC